MKRVLLGTLVVGVAILLGGCPIYSTSRDYPACNQNGGCFDCPYGSTPSDGTCVPWQCSSSADCPSGYACSGYSCVLAPDATDCSSGCPTGYICKLSGGATQCVPASSLGSDAGVTLDAAAGDGASGSDAATDAGMVEDGHAEAASTLDGAPAIDAADAARVVDGFAGDVTPSSDGSDASTIGDASEASTGVDSGDSGPPSSCNASDECGGNGAKCIDGRCTPQNHLCSDGTQCVAATDSCVDGVCEPHCSAGAPCPAGYECDFGRGVCNVNPAPCQGSGSSTCQGGSTCVENRCVAPCAQGDAGVSCPSGLICVNGGCIPDEAATFDCKNDGQGGTLATTCAATEICLHHDCYSACDPDAGSAACADPGAVCKQVTIGAGTYLVCGAPTNLGSDCDPATGKYCASAACIDGYCQ